MSEEIRVLAIDTTVAYLLKLENDKDGRLPSGNMDNAVNGLALRGIIVDCNQHAIHKSKLLSKKNHLSVKKERIDKQM